MTGTTTVKRFNADPQRVFEVLSDFDHAAGRIEAIKKLEVVTDGPVGKGTRFRETRVMFGKEATEEMTITDWDPPRGYTVEAESCGSHYTSIFTFKPDGDGTIVEMTWQARPLNFFAKIIMWPMGKMMMKMCQKMFDKDLEDLRRAVESGDGAAPSAQPA